MNELQRATHLKESTRLLVTRLAMERANLAECTNPVLRDRHIQYISDLSNILYDRTGTRY